MRGLLFCASLSVFCAGVAQASTSTILNGSLEGPLRNGVLSFEAVPTGWSVARQTPDTSGLGGNVGGAGEFVIVPSGVSPDGGTWVSLGADPFVTVSGAPFSESISQVVSGLVIGDSYTLGWFVGNFGAASVDGTILAEAAGAIRALLSGNVIGTGQIRAVGASWYAETASFVATASTHTIAFEAIRDPAGSGTAYMALDGVRFVPASTTPVPLPAALPLLAASAGALVLTARRRT